MAADRAAAQLALERELAAARAQAERARRREAFERAGAFAVGGPDDVVPMEALGASYRRLAAHDRLGSAVQAAAK